MTRVTFVVGNNGHHTAMMAPVARVLRERKVAVRVLSFSLFRGSPSPRAAFEQAGAELREVIPFRTRGSPAVGAHIGAKKGGSSRRVLQRAAWHLAMRPRLRSLALRRPDVLVVPHDAAFPYDRLCSWFGARGVPYVLMQEGVRFAMPIDTDEVAYGKGGAAAVAAWGESSAEHFRSIGVPPSTVHATGCPRFDALDPASFRADGARLREQLGLTDQTLLYLSNPIEMQGYANIEEKVGLFGRFLDGLGELLAEPAFRVLVKLHPREDPNAFRAVVQARGLGARVAVPDGLALFPAFCAARASVVLTSTVGLEGLLFELPLGVLELPGAGFGYDYVSEGVGLGLGWSAPLAPQVRRLMTTWGEESRPRRAAYVERSLAHRGRAAHAVADLLEEIARRPRP